jgi:diguanylate cyclase (GGDEF)-like protein
VHTGGSGLFLCMPIAAHSEILGVLHVRLQESIRVQADDNANDPIIRIIGAVAEQTALSLANLRLRNRLQEQSLRDPLTKLFNRRYLEESFLREEKLAIRNKKIIGVIMLDVDYFKKVNDTFGHDAGDMVLVSLGKFLQETFRGEDIVCRYGGEEFVIILPGAGIKECAERAEMVRQTVETRLKPVYADKTIDFTVSAGVAIFTGSETKLQSVLEAADQALYKAKDAGRNRVVCAGNDRAAEQ